VLYSTFLVNFHCSYTGSLPFLYKFYALDMKGSVMDSRLASQPSLAVLSCLAISPASVFFMMTFTSACSWRSTVSGPMS
jgi:hypothetical protein